jgi:outer membrane protein OmpA-like peptidoglycan-associated protein
LRNSILFFLFWVSIQALSAQKPAALKSQGEAAFVDKRWSEALDNLSQYQTQKPGDLGVLSKIGQAAYQLHLPDQAKQYLEFVIKQGKSINPTDWYYLARTYHGLQEWELAIDGYKQFLRLAPADHPLRANVRDNISRCVNGIGAPANDNVALVENLGTKINTAGDEFAPLGSVNHSDRLYFSAARSNATGGVRNDEGYEDHKKGHWCSDMYFSNRTTGGWEDATPFSALQNTSRFEVALGFTNNGQVLYFFRGFTLYGGEIFTDTSGLTDEYKSAPQPFAGPMRPEEGDESPYYFNDSTLVFASRRPGGQGGLDLWASQRYSGVWSVAVNLGPAVNSAYDETTPFLASDGLTLYFSSNHVSGIGGYDVFKSVFSPESREWSVPVSMGVGINSSGDDTWFRPVSDGATAYLVSNKISDNYGMNDIYMVYFKEPLPEQQSRQGFAIFAPIKAVEASNELPSLVIAPLFYTIDRDINNAENANMIKSVAAVARQFPDIRLLVTVHTDESGPAKFDLYAGIKRAELVGKALTAAGAPAERIVLRSAGSGFPLARNFQDGAPNATAQSLNRRVELAPVLISGEMPIQFRLDRPLVNDVMAAAGTTRLDDQSKGLLFRVEMAVARQVITTDALGLFNDILIESEPGSGEYRYVGGAERSHVSASQLRKEMVSAGFPNATVAAYINGARVSRAEAIGLVKKYPELAAYIRG